MSAIISSISSWLYSFVSSEVPLPEVAVIGVGFVGELIVEAFSKAYRVIGYDKSPKRAEEMRQRFASNKNVTIQSTTDGLEKCKLFSISVPTLLIRDPETGSITINDSHVKSAISLVEGLASPGSVVVLESSVHVGMSRKLLIGLRQKGVFVGFSPERVDPGRTFPTPDKTHKVISGFDKESLEQILPLYSRGFEFLVPVSSMEVAEYTKLWENCFRAINIAYVNELADAALKNGVNPYEIVKACSTKDFGFMPFYPSLGVGGHCIPVNPYWLQYNNDVPFLITAAKMNSDRPIHEARKLMKNGDVNRVLVVGIGFKPGERLTTNSPGLDYAKELLAVGANVTIYDPLLSADDQTVTQFPRLSRENWNPDYLDHNFDVVTIAIRQHEVDFNILKHCNSTRVVKYCDLN
jgi:nucleotide sugar dehydrogenase